MALKPLTTVTLPAARPRREFTIYECPTCGDRLHGEQRCPTCGIFTRRLDISGSCPHCDQPVALHDLLDHGYVRGLRARQQNHDRDLVSQSHTRYRGRGRCARLDEGQAGFRGKGNE